LRKKHGSSLDKGHYFVLAPLGGIGSCFRASKLIGITLGHALDATLVNSRALGSAAKFKVYAKSALREALPLAGAAIGGFGVRIGESETLNHRVPGSSPDAPTKPFKSLAAFTV
jgi:hypothetical protein